MRHSLAQLLELVGFSYRGLDARSFEPMFLDPEGRERPFDALPTRVRHLIAFAALPVRMLFAAYPGSDPKEAEGVVAIDEADLHQDPQTLVGLIAALNRALPRVQWILTTSSATLASSADTRDVLALRRLPDGDRVELCVGEAARTH
jgi:predicted ATP-binding protein involved in virulence